MKKAIFLCDKKDKFNSVYTSDVISKIKNISEIDEKVYTKADVLLSVECFRDTQMIFSTWGMPTFSQEEIDLCFPNLECIFYAAGTVQKFARPFIEKGVKVFSAWAANAVPVAEYTVAQIVLSNKGFFAHSRLMSQKKLDSAKELIKYYPGNYNEKKFL